MSQGQRENYRKRRERIARQQRRKRRMVLVGLVIVAILLAVGILKLGNFIIVKIEESKIDYSVYWAKEEEDMTVEMPEVDIQLLTINEYSRPGTSTERIQNIVIHYTANPGTTAQQNRDYFEGLKDSELTYASSNFIIGIDGEIIQCVPTTEIAYASNDANIYSVSIELCHEDETGEFTDATYESLVALTAYLCDKFDLESEDVIRHYDVTGKLCPLYYVHNEEAYEQLHTDITDAMK
ncbi:MAG: peptidoglycan recognition family protein [Eubacteriales bacterium]